MLNQWLTQVPEDFAFTLKASRVITHEKRLQDCGQELVAMWQNFSPLGKQLHAVLFQIPPSLYLDFDRLKTFVELLYHSNPLPVHIAFEFHHHSWYTPEVFKLLSSRGYAIVLHDMPRRGGFSVLTREGLEDTLIGLGTQKMKVQQWIEYARASFFYLRLHGTVQGYAFSEYGERYLRPWAKIGREVLATGVPLYAYFNNDPDARATRDAKRFNALIGLPALKTSVPLRTAPRLF